MKEKLKRNLIRLGWVELGPPMDFSGDIVCHPGHPGHGIHCGEVGRLLSRSTIGDFLSKAKSASRAVSK